MLVEREAQALEVVEHSRAEVEEEVLTHATRHPGELTERQHPHRGSREVPQDDGGEDTRASVGHERGDAAVDADLDEIGARHARQVVSEEQERAETQGAQARPGQRDEETTRPMSQERPQGRRDLLCVLGGDAAPRRLVAGVQPSLFATAHATASSSSASWASTAR